MASFDHTRRSRQFRPEGLGPELLEQREVMAASAMGFSLPDVSVGNYTSPVASWGQPYTVQVQAFNRGASSLPQAGAQFPWASSTSDAVTSVDVYLTRGKGPHAHRAFLQTLDLGTIRQNSVYGSGTDAQFNINMPATPPAGFPAAGGAFRLVFVPNVSNQIRLNGVYPNQGSYSVPVKVLPSLPQVQFLGSNTPRSLVPGQVFTPEIKIQNIGAADINTQVTTANPLTVLLVASTDQFYDAADVVLDTLTITDLQGLNQRPLAGGLRNLAAGTVNNLSLALNQASVTGAKLTLPVTGAYYVGYIVDPDHAINMISDQAGIPRSARLLDLRLVAGRTGYDAPQNLTNSAASLFPNVPYAAPTTTVIGPDTLQVAPVVSYPPNAALGGIKTKPKGWN